MNRNDAETRREYLLKEIHNLTKTIRKLKEKKTTHQYEMDASNLQNSIETLERIRDIHQSELNKLDSQTIYLIQPGYSGDFPETGTFISVVKFPNMPEVEVEPITKGKVDLSYPLNEDFENLFDNHQELDDAINFVKLVLYYHYHYPTIEKFVLLDDSRIEEILYAYGIEL